MYVITKQKPFEETKQNLEGEGKIYIIGCGTCATVCRTGGKEQVLEMRQKLEEEGKAVAGWMVIPTVCDSLTKEALAEEAAAIAPADAILVMSCAFGVQNVGRYTDRAVIPALDTLFMGMEDLPGSFSEACVQCGECVLAWTGGICPVTACPKGLINGACGGAKDGKCEVHPDNDCAWALIYQRLKEQGKVDKLHPYRSPKNFQLMARPRRGICG